MSGSRTHVAELDLPIALSKLARRRPIFHSEADFQFALAWELQTLHPEADIRLEHPTAYGREHRYLDVWLRLAATEHAIELKYFARAIRHQATTEEFWLPHRSAYPIGRYQAIHDIQRLEDLAATRGIHGHFVLVTNDPLYWTPPIAVRENVDLAFQLHEGRDLSGTLAWNPRAKGGTIKGRQEPLVIRGPHRLRWRPYSKLGSGRGSEFRYLLVDLFPA